MEEWLGSYPILSNTANKRSGPVEHLLLSKEEVISPRNTENILAFLVGKMIYIASNTLKPIIKRKKFTPTKRIKR